MELVETGSRTSDNTNETL